MKPPTTSTGNSGTGQTIWLTFGAYKATNLSHGTWLVVSPNGFVIERGSQDDAIAEATRLEAAYQRARGAE